MNVQWENLVMSSLMLRVDSLMCNNGGFINHSGKFYKTQKQFNQYHSYSLPYKQIVSDVSVSGANILQGVDVTTNGQTNFRSIGEDGFSGILHHKGTVLFNSDKDSSLIEGAFAVKEYNVYLTTKAEENLLFKTAKQVNPKIEQVESGLDPNTEAYPAIFLKNMGGTNVPFGFAGVSDTVSYVRAVILSNSAFSLDSVCSLLKNEAKERIPIIENLPFNAIGAYTGNSFDYAALVANATLYVTAWNVNVSKVMPDTSGMKDLNLDVFAAFVDFEMRSFG